MCVGVGYGIEVFVQVGMWVLVGVLVGIGVNGMLARAWLGMPGVSVLVGVVVKRGAVSGCPLSARKGPSNAGEAATGTTSTTGASANATLTDSPIPIAEVTIAETYNQPLKETALANIRSFI